MRRDKVTLRLIAQAINLADSVTTVIRCLFWYPRQQCHVTAHVSAVGDASEQAVDFQKLHRGFMTANLTPDRTI